MNLNLKKKNIIVFGSEGLIGKKICLEIIKSNGNLISADIKKKKSNDYFQIDVNNISQLHKLKKKIIKKYRSIDAIIICVYPKAKIKNRDFFKINNQLFLKELNLHFGAYFNIHQVFLKYFHTIKSGNIINFSSMYGNFIPRFEIYANTKMNMPIQYLIVKSSIIKMTEYLAKISLKKNVRLNCVSPGGVFDYQDKKFIKKYSSFCNSNNLLDPNDISGLILFLLSDLSEKITGQNFIIDDGFTL